jgi:23S rRNA (uracil1939-C5)-methyltransferase
MPTITTEANAPKSTATVQVEKLVYGGDGLARLDGQVVLTPFVLPAEQIEVITNRGKGSLLRGRSPQIIQPSVHRTLPRCEYFANCGGCHYQHAEYAYQLEAKRGILRETLQRLGGITYDDEIGVISGDPWNYRNRIQLHSSERRLGFRKAESHDVCPITHCEISSPALNEAIAKLGQAVQRKEWPTFLRTIELFTDENQMQLTVVETTRPVAARFFAWCESLIPSLTADPLNYKVAEHSFRISRGSFFQVNRFLVEALITEAISGLEGKSVLDLYAGVGLFSLPLAQRFAEVTAVERSAWAYRDLQWNASQGSGNIRTAKMAAETFLQELTETPDLIVADPPRAGLGKEATDEILRLLPPQLTYVSCDVATLARDIRKLMSAYTIRRLTLVDLFPQTYHFESVVHLRRK